MSKYGMSSLLSVAGFVSLIISLPMWWVLTYFSDAPNRGFGWVEFVFTLIYIIQWGMWLVGLFSFENKARYSVCCTLAILSPIVLIASFFGLVSIDSAIRINQNTKITSDNKVISKSKCKAENATSIKSQSKVVTMPGGRFDESKLFGQNEPIKVKIIPLGKADVIHIDNKCIIKQNYNYVISLDNVQFWEYKNNEPETRVFELDDYDVAKQSFDTKIEFDLNNSKPNKSDLSKSVISKVFHSTHQLTTDANYITIKTTKELNYYFVLDIQNQKTLKVLKNNQEIHWNSNKVFMQKESNENQKITFIRTEKLRNSKNEYSDYEKEKSTLTTSKTNPDYYEVKNYGFNDSGLANFVE